MKPCSYMFFAVVAGLLMCPIDLIGQSSSQGSDAREEPGTQQSSSAQQGSESKQGSATKGSETSPAATATPPFEKQFWNYLRTSRYKNWAPVPGKTDDFQPGGEPHGSLIKMYLNRIAAGNSQAMPNGSVVVKENYSSDKQLMAITVMYKTDGFNPDAGDWYWVKYRSDGSVFTTGPEAGSAKIMGRAKGCIECHATAAGGDFAFFNDEK